MSTRKKMMRSTAPRAYGVIGTGSTFPPRGDLNILEKIGDRKDVSIGTGAGINTALRGSHGALVSMSRKAVRDQSIASHAVDVLTDYVVGEGLQPSIPDDDLELLRLWRRWTKYAGAETLVDFSEVQSTAFREMLVGGDAFGILRYRPGEQFDSLPVRLQIQVAAAEMVPYWTNLRQPDGSAISGILYDNYNVASAYYVFTRHPGEFQMLMNEGAPKTVKHEARDVAHLFMPEEAGQRRGVPALSKALIALDDLEKYLGAELLRKVLAANISYWLQLPDLTPEEKEERRDILWNEETQKYENSVGEEVEPPDEETMVAPKSGTVGILPPGGEIKQMAPAESGNSFAPFLRHILMQISASLNLPIEFLFGDFSGVNDRLYKAVAAKFERHIQRQRKVLAARFLNRIWNTWIRTAVADGSWKIPSGKTIEDYLDPEWVGQPIPQLHKLQDAQANGVEVDRGWITGSDVIRKRGDDPDRVRRERLDDLVKDIESGVAAIPDHWTSRMIKKHLGWSEEEISEYRALTERAAE
ncbi:phage portal protein, lambda family [Roseovarius sp. A-2]|uniref:phage portal protein n=1 Tax=Roseovarius sp. A-2 TaxID=1570360 RepID=UPI0009B5657A|nr:phage portal protein [Roseovarius sp. A-2]GAW36996.1 phage portal protein, lambda family [Roseovarius sp. A-2]